VLDRLGLMLRFLPALPRLARYRAGSSHTVADRIEALAASDPEEPFLLYEAERQTYGEHNAAANRVAGWALEQGLGHGDVVALLMENRPEYLATWAGLAKLGVTTALINTNLQGPGLRHALASARTRHLILGSECADRFATTSSELDSPLDLWAMRDPFGEGPAELPAGAEDLDAALAEKPTSNPDPAHRKALRAGDDLFYIYTSGTTGLPKAARFSHMKFLGIGELAAWAVDLRRTDVHYCALPLYHSAGGAMVVSGVQAAGASLVVRRKFSASRFWDDVREYDATHFQYIGEFCRYLLNQPATAKDRSHRIRAILGNGLRPDIWEEFQQRFGIDRIVEFYGATEGNTALLNLEGKVGSVGRFPFKALTNARLIRYDLDADEPVRDERGLCLECATGEAGELVGRIPRSSSSPTGRFEGYTSKEATDRKILRDVFEAGDAWFRSGDLLRQDDEGFFYFVDRIGDTFRWKGENVSTQEVAEAVSAFAGVEMANAYGVEVAGQDGRAGMVALRLAAGAGFDGAGFFSFVTDALPRYAAPLFVRILPELAVTGTFKLRKVELQHEGFDPDTVSDPVWFRDDTEGRYVPLDADLAGRIGRGEIKI
jgi:fatty-acyl-CoA synthase